jgi:hypothetical protein
MSILSAVDCGNLHIIKNADRPSAAVITDTGVDAASGWQDVDLSSYVPNGTKAVVIDFYIQVTNADDFGFWYIRADDETNALKMRATAIAGEQGASNTKLLCEATVWAPNGVFQYKGHDVFPLSSLNGYLKGYYI